MSNYREDIIGNNSIIDENKKFKYYCVRIIMLERKRKGNNTKFFIIPSKLTKRLMYNMRNLLCNLTVVFALLTQLR